MAPWMRRWGPFVVAAAVVVLVVANAASWAASPPGDSHDGRNAAVWGLSARGLLEDPIGSRLGGVQPSGTAYANHPPAIVVVAAATTAATGGHPLGLHLPGIAATAAAVLLLVVLLRRSGLPDLAVGAAVVVGGTTPMLLTYGTMLDTPVLALPVAVATLLAGQEVRHGRTVRSVALVAVGLAAGLTSWQGAVLAFVVAATTVAGTADRRKGLRAAVLLGAGAMGGCLLSVAWAWWAYGDLGILLDAFAQRRGAAPVWWEAQRTFTADLFGPALLVVVVGAVLVSLVRRRHRVLLGAPLLVVVGWSRLADQAASIHDYWNYLGILVVAVAAGVVVEAGADAVRRWTPSLAPLAAGALVVGVGLLAASAVLVPSDAERRLVDGVPAGRAAAKLARAGSPDAVVVRSDVSSIPGGAAWAAWSAHGLAPDASPDELASLARSDPDAPVLFAIPAGYEASDRLLSIAVAVDGRYVIAPASVFAPGG